MSELCALPVQPLSRSATVVQYPIAVLHVRGAVQSLLLVHESRLSREYRVSSPRSGHWTSPTISVVEVVVVVVVVVVATGPDRSTICCALVCASFSAAVQTHVASADAVAEPPHASRVVPGSVAAEQSPWTASWHLSYASLVSAANPLP